MVKKYNERRNHQIQVLVDRRKNPLHPKDVPAEMIRLGYGIITYQNVRKIISRWRKMYGRKEAA